MTTKRRNLAMVKRRELLDSGELVQAYIKFPALLMGKKPGQKKYDEIEDFSSTKVEVKSFVK